MVYVEQWPPQHEGVINFLRDAGPNYVIGVKSFVILHDFASVLKKTSLC